MMQSKALAPSVCLPYLGVLPFVCCTLLLIAGHHSLPIFDSVLHILVTYSLVIATFMAGSLWGMHLGLGAKGKNLAVLSNALTVVMWLIFLLLDAYWLLFLYAVFFVVLLLIDAGLKRRGLLSNTYWKTRLIVTSLVVMSLFGAGFSASIL